MVKKKKKKNHGCFQLHCCCEKTTLLLLMMTEGLLYMGVAEEEEEEEEKDLGRAAWSIAGLSEEDTREEAHHDENGYGSSLAIAVVVVLLRLAPTPDSSWVLFDETDQLQPREQACLEFELMMLAAELETSSSCSSLLLSSSFFLSLSSPTVVFTLRTKKALVLP